jgi:hypothetical protein
VVALISSLTARRGEEDFWIHISPCYRVLFSLSLFLSLPSSSPFSFPFRTAVMLRRRVDSFSVNDSRPPPSYIPPSTSLPIPTYRHVSSHRLV